MITLQPQISISFKCPACSHDSITAQNTFWQGTHLLADCTCDNCDLAFWHTFPVKHTRYFPLSFAKNERRVFMPPNAGHWLYEPLFESHYANRQTTAKFQKKVRRTFRNIVILNCLDYLYGHALLQLLNAQAHLSQTPHLGLVVLVPANLAWLVPDGVAEVWEVDAPLSGFRNKIAGLDAFVKAELPRFETVYLSETNIQPDWYRIDIEHFTRTKPFNLGNFQQKKPQITFLWREDRYWLSRFDDLLWRVAFKLRMPTVAQPYLLWRQKGRFVRTARRIARQLPTARFAVAGVGQRQAFPAFFEDFRQIRPDVETERAWCQLYADSHVVVGIHGSNLLLPSALAASFVELLPRYRLANFGEATATRHGNRVQGFLGRSLDAFSKPALVAAHIVQIIEGFSLFRQVLEDANE